MNTTKIYQDSWSMTRYYRALWIFGVILALTTISLGSALWLRNDNDNDQENRTLVNWEISAKDQAWVKDNFGLDLPLRYKLTTADLRVNLDDPSLSRQERIQILRTVSIMIAVLLVLWVIRLALRYISETALITMVNDHSVNDETYSARQGWRLGFSKAATKLSPGPTGFRCS